MLRHRAARTIMLVCSLFARLPRYGPSAAGIVRHRDSARPGPGVHEPAARDSLRYSLIPRRVVKIGLLIRGSPTAGHRAALAALLLSGQPPDVLDQDALGNGCRWAPPTSTPSPCLSTTGPSWFSPPTRTTAPDPVSTAPTNSAIWS